MGHADHMAKALLHACMVAGHAPEHTLHKALQGSKELAHKTELDQEASTTQLTEMRAELELLYKVLLQASQGAAACKDL